MITSPALKKRETVLNSPRPLLLARVTPRAMSGPHGQASAPGRRQRRPVRPVIHRRPIRLSCRLTPLRTMLAARVSHAPRVVSPKPPRAAATTSALHLATTVPDSLSRLRRALAMSRMGRARGASLLLDRLPPRCRNLARRRPLRMSGRHIVSHSHLILHHTHVPMGLMPDNIHALISIHILRRTHMHILILPMRTLRPALSHPLPCQRPLMFKSTKSA
ncbi:hypothetical protein FKP32DRAFT_1169493 [Trametes sanguinea]|nr:hypothetical protein FKP32DRAFT_1169493 [Trametes sanguinea]